MEIKNTDICIIAGMRGFGKTTLFKALVVDAKRSPDFARLKVETRVIDPLMELKDIGGEYVAYGDRVNYNKILKYAFQKKNVFLPTDEADGFFKNKSSLTKIENEFIHIGRHWGSGAIFCTRRLSNMHTDLVSQANKLFIFKLVSKADLDYFAGCGFGEYVDYVANLNKYEFLVIDNDTGEVYVSPPI